MLKRQAILLLNHNTKHDSLNDIPKNKIKTSVSCSLNIASSSTSSAKSTKQEN